jgi:hypothetical protein
MFQEKWPEKYGEVYRIFLGNHCYVVISTPELLEVKTFILRGRFWAELKFTTRECESTDSCWIN